MDEQGIKRFIAALDADVGDMRSTGDWINMKCPLAPYTHASGTDSRPSFGISISDEKPSVYYCFGCSPDGQPLGRLLHSMWLGSGEYPWEAAKIYRENEIHDREDAPFVAPDPWTAKESRETKPIPAKVLRRFPTLQSTDNKVVRQLRRWLLVERGIPEWVQNMYGVRYNPENESLIFPLVDVSGRVFTLRERLTDVKRIWTISPELAGYRGSFTSLRVSGAWFGLHLVDWEKPVIPVEGEMDAMRLAALGCFNSVASATSSVTRAQAEALVGETDLLGYDADKGGSRAHARLRGFLKTKAVLFRLNWKLATRADGKPCKDAGDLPDKDELQKVLDGIELF